MKFFFTSTRSTLFLCSLLISISFSSCSSVHKIKREVRTAFETGPEFQQGFSGFVLYDPLKKKVIVEHNAGKYFTPASNTKLFTFYAGLKILEDSVPALKYTVVNDSLLFSGTGDPSFLNPDLPESKVVEFLRNRKEKLFYVLPNFTESHFGPGWAWNWYTAYYAVERTSFPIYGNRVSFKFDKGKEAPLVKPVIFGDSLFTSHNPSSSRVGRELYSNRFNYSNLDRDKEFRQNVPFRYSPELFVKLLSDSLGREVEMIRKAPANVNLDQVFYSIPADSLYKRMLVVSDNFIAEQILLLASNELSDTLRSRTTIDYMKEHHLQDLPDEPIWRDGSGLSPNNKFTPRSIVKLLDKLRAEVPHERLLSMMATGGESGTIRNYYKGEEEPYVFAKTGTLSNVHALSGFLKTKSGKWLIFSFQNNNYVVPTSDIRNGMERILRTIRDTY